MAESDYAKLEVGMRKTAQGDHYTVFVTADGAEVPLTSIPSGEFEQRVVEAAAVAAAEKAASKK